MSSVVELVIKFVTHRRLRSLLTTVGIAIGVALVFSLIAINRGFIISLSSMLSNLGDNFVTVLPKQANFGFSTSSYFTQKDADAIRRLPFVKIAVAGYSTVVPAKIHGEELFLMARGANPKDMDELFNEVQVYGFHSGRAIHEGERGKVVVGYNLADKYHLSPGSQIEIAGEKFRVVGVQSKVGNNQYDNLITANVEDLWDITGEHDKYFLILLKVSEMKTEELKRELKRIRGKEDFEILTPENIARQVSEILGVVNAVFLAVASISILVGSVNVANTMYMAVTERVRDIGIMKAVGANRKQISTIFMLESGVLSMVGGFFGVLLGLLVTWGFSYFGGVSGAFISFGYPLNPDLILFTIVLSFVVGVVSGYFPARYASGMEPVRALRQEI